jgi:hypothetical protein
MVCNDDEEAKIQNTKSQTEAALGATFELLFGMKLPELKFFAFFCNLVNILYPAAATKIKIQIRGFLQLGQNTVVTALDNNNNNTIALLNSTTKAGNLRRGASVVLPPRGVACIRRRRLSIHGCAAQISFSLHSSTNLALTFAHSTF